MLDREPILADHDGRVRARDTPGRDPGQDGHRPEHPSEYDADQRPCVPVHDGHQEEQWARDGKRNPEHQEQPPKDSPLAPTELQRTPSC